MAPRPSSSYPGIYRQYEEHRLACELPAHLFRGVYVEHGHELTTVFRWEVNRRNRPLNS